jgi:hypothetical protein
VTEKLNVLMHQGSVSKLMIIGEVCVPKSSLIRILDAKKSGKKDEKEEDDGARFLGFSIDGINRLEKIVYPHDLVLPSDCKSLSTPPTTDVETGEYRLDLSRLQALFLSSTSSSTPENEEEGLSILKYRVLIDHHSRAPDDPQLVQQAARHVPLIVVPKWRYHPEKTELVVQYRESLPFRDFHHQLSVDKEKREMRLEELEVQTSVYFDHATKTKVCRSVDDVQSLPAGQFEPQTNSIRWILDHHLLQTGGDNSSSRSGSGGVRVDGLEGKLVCRFIHQSVVESTSPGPGGSDEGDGDGQAAENHEALTGHLQED